MSKMFNFRNMTQAMFQQYLNSNPNAMRAWKMMKQMSNGKTPEQRRMIVENLAKERNISMEELKQKAQEMGFNMPD